MLTLPGALYALVASWNWASVTKETLSPPVTFELRHQHAATKDSRIIFSDFNQASFTGDLASFSLDSKKGKIYKPESNAAFNAARRNSRTGITPALGWDEQEVAFPDLSKRRTLYQLAQMATNAYYPDNSTSGWYDISDDYKSTPWGWLPTDDGMRGHVFVSSDNKTAIISIKGTSAIWPAGGGGPTVSKDKKNDNLLFSCCCARVGPTWSTVCNCYDGGYRCDSDCVEDALRDEGLFYPIGLNLYNNVSYMYPDANIWLTGHSLGGGLASLMGLTFGAPVVAFEAPAERMAARRLHLPSPPSTNHITHVYNTGDPIPMGVCTGVTSMCAIGGFALESRCHTGQVIQYDTVSKLGWSVHIQNHGIDLVAEKLLSDHADWKPEFNEPEDENQEGGLFSSFRWGWGKRKEDPEDEPKTGGREVPLPRPAEEVEGVDGVCSDCFNWEFGSFKNHSQARSAVKRCS